MDSEQSHYIVTIEADRLSQRQACYVCRRDVRQQLHQYLSLAGRGGDSIGPHHAVAQQPVPHRSQVAAAATPKYFGPKVLWPEAGNPAKRSGRSFSSGKQRTTNGFVFSLRALRLHSIAPAGWLRSHTGWLRSHTGWLRSHKGRL